LTVVLCVAMLGALAILLLPRHREPGEAK
jgi:hypothetical protein